MCLSAPGAPLLLSLFRPCSKPLSPASPLNNPFPYTALPKASALTSSSLSQVFLLSVSPLYSPFSVPFFISVFMPCPHCSLPLSPTVASQTSGCYQSVTPLPPRPCKLAVAACSAPFWPASGCHEKTIFLQ